MKTGSPSVPSSRRRYLLRARKRSIDRFAEWQNRARSAFLPFTAQSADGSVSAARTSGRRNAR